MSAWPRIRALLRVELRQLSRSKARSVLIAALIAVPVAALVGGSTLVRIIERTPQERVVRQLGAADLRVDGPVTVLDRALLRLPPGARSERVTQRPEHLDVLGLRLAASRGSITPGGLAEPMYCLVTGRWPSTPDEVALSPVLMRCAQASLGDTVTLASDRRAATIVGIVADPDDLERAVVLVSGESSSAFDARLVALPDLEQTGSIVAALRSEGLQVRTAGEVRAATGSMSQVLFLLGNLGFVEAALVVAAAFAIGLRRRQRQIGLLTATGADPRVVVGAILGSVAVLAVIGGVIGAAVGLGAVAIMHPYLDAWTGRMNGPFEVAAPELLAAVGIGIATAVVSAWVPACSAVRLPVRLALGGRRPPATPAAPWLVAGAVMIVVALGLTMGLPMVEGPVAMFGALAASILGVLGFGASSPWLLDWLARHSSRLPLAWRFAVRDAGRFRSRNGPVVTAVLAGMAVSVTTAAIIASIGSLGDESIVVLRDDQLIVEGPAAATAGERIAAALSPVATASLDAAWIDGAPIRARFAGSTEHDWVAIADVDLLQALAIEADAGADQPVELVSARDWRILALLPGDDLCWRPRSPAFVIPAAAAARLGLETGPPPQHTAAWLLRLPQPVDAAVLERARATTASLAGASVSANLERRRGPRVLFRVVLLISVLTGLLVIGVATALTTVESHADRRALLEVGATPRQSRSHAAAGAAYLALLGCALAVPAGLLPAVGATATLVELPFVMPWAEIALSAVALPILAYVVAWCLTRPAVWVRRV